MAKSGAGCARGNPVEEAALLTSLLSAGTKAKQERLWGDFVRRYERLIAVCVVKTMRRYGALFSREDLDDLVGEVWLMLLRDDMRKLRQYDAARGFRLASFLALVATNATIDHLRGRQVEATPLDEVLDDWATRHAEPPRDLVEKRQELEMARSAIAQLPRNDQDFVIECFHKERAPEEIAREHGVTVSTVYSRKFKIREKLQQIVRSIEELSVHPQLRPN
jgi:RNA polymerase sigma-70 factor (ECF subfamily)